MLTPKAERSKALVEEAVGRRDAAEDPQQDLVASVPLTENPSASDKPVWPAREPVEVQHRKRRARVARVDDRRLRPTR